MGAGVDRKRWAGHLAAARREGKSLAQYAREHRLSASSLYGARYAERRAEHARPVAGTFVPIKITEAAPSMSSARVRASLPNGIVLEMFVREQDSPMLGALLSSLANLPCSG